MRNRSGQLVTADVLESNPNSLAETSIRPECLPEPIRHCITATEAKVGDAPDMTLPRRALGPWELTEKQQASLVELHAKIKMYNKAVPGLRLQLPSYCLSYSPYLSLNLEICADYYFKCEHMRFDEDAGSKIAECLSFFLEENPFEWNVCTWKNDFIAGLMLQVGVSIAISQATKPLQPHIPDPEAHEAYLFGRYNWYKRTTAGWKIGEEYFRRAIQKDPDYAAAYAGLAECRIPRSEAQAAALRAIALDPRSGEARTALAWVQLYWYLDPSAAEPAFKEAIQLAPNYAQAHYSYGAYLGFIGHPNEAIDEVKQALLLDPLSSVFRAGLAGGLFQAGQQDEAIKQLRIVFATDPHFAVAHEVLGGIYAQQGKYKEAIEEFQTKARLGGDPNLSAIGYTYARWGKKKEALRTLSQLQKSGGSPAGLALVELGLGHKEKALAWLEKAYEDHDDDALLDLKMDPTFDPLRSDPRFQDLLRRMKFPS